MFRFLEIELHGWDLWPPFVVPLDAGVVVLSGPNGSGKTTFLDAIRQLLHAPHLSQKRRLSKYLRRPNRPALLRAVVTNRLDDRNRRPFDRQQVFTDEATLACALVPDGGTPEKRYLVLPGRVPASELQNRLLDGRDWLGPDEYKRLLEYAGVSRSLMHILALEQGRADALADQKPNELFRWVMTARGSQQVLERYQAARRRFSDSLGEVTRQSQAVIRHQAELGELQRKIQRLADYRERQDRITTAEKIAKASLYQSLLHEQIAIDSKLPELRTKATNLATTLDRLRRDLHSDTGALERLRESGRQAQERAAALLAECDELGSETAALQANVDRLRGLGAELAAIDLEAVNELEAELQRVQDQTAGRRLEITGLERRISALRERKEDLERGIPRFPEPVESTLQALRDAGIEAKLVADRIEVRDERWARAIESALGASRYAIHVPAGQERAATQIAAKHAFPGPLITALSAESHEGEWLHAQIGAPRWIAEWERKLRFVDTEHPDGERVLTPSGVRRDGRGVWVSVAPDRVLGESGRRAELARVEAELSDAVRAHDVMTTALNELVEHAAELETRLSRQRERMRLAIEIRVLPEQERTLERKHELLTTRRTEREKALITSTETTGEIAAAEAALTAKTTTVAEREKELAGLRTAVSEGDTKLEELAPRIASARAGVSPEFLIRAEAGTLPQHLLAERDVESATNALARFVAEGPIPDDSVVKEHEVLKRTIEEFEQHIAERQAEADRAQQELDRCRGDYLDVVRSTLHDYARRARALAEVAAARIEIDQPHLANDDRILDEAGIAVRIGFDGKPPTDLADPAHSGGQRVIAGLVLLMAMAETEGDSFFIVDEPFAHLSMDRVDDVGRFLRTSGAQFLITVPTTLDRGQLDPASLLIVLYKKPAGDDHAKRPMVLRP